jgi:hypothetical protein
MFCDCFLGFASNQGCNFSFDNEHEKPPQPPPAQIAKAAS